MHNKKRNELNPFMIRLHQARKLSEYIDIELGFLELDLKYLFDEVTQIRNDVQELRRRRDENQ